MTGAAGVPGVAGPTGPQAAQGVTGRNGTDAVQPLSGLRFSVQGDSIAALFKNAWQNVVISRTGMLLASQDARPGRTFASAFECYGNPSVGGTLATFDPTIKTPFGTCGAFSTGATAGNTLAQNLADVDVLIIALGTNDTGIQLGVMGDATNAGTFYGNMRWLTETYLTANPSLRIIFVTIEYTANLTRSTVLRYANATVSYGESMGIPVINMAARGGVNASTTALLLRDGLHPSDYAFSKIYGPAIADGILAAF